MKRPLKILSVSSSRADIGILVPVWEALCDISGVRLHVLLTGMHLDENAPPVKGIPHGVNIHQAGADIGGDTASRAGHAMGQSVTRIVPVLDDVKPDLLLVVGDRLDMLPAVVASLPFNIPIAHLHGGEITEGAIDDRIRHAISKLAHIHLVSCQSARTNLLGMGETDNRIHVTGAPGLDTLLAAPILPRPEFLRQAGLPELRDFRLVTIHPETNSASPLAPLRQTLKALAARPGPTLITAPNSDPGGGAARTEIEEFAGLHDWVVFVDTLGSRLYPNALRHAAFMVGNSSSGILEAGLFGLPAVNVGDRQKGRERGGNVLDVASDAASIIKIFDRLGSSPARIQAQSPYGDGQAAKKIASILCDLPTHRKMVEKQLVLAS